MNFAPGLKDKLGFQHPDIIALVADFDRQHDVWREEDATFPPPFVTCLDRDSESNAKVGGKGTSWHLWRCAVDFRNKHYTPKQTAKCVDWLKARCEHPLWEVVVTVHGTGPHFHIGRRDFSWRTR